MKIKVSRVAAHIIAALIGIIWFLPILGIIMVAIRPIREVLDGWWNFDVFHLTLDNFKNALTSPTALLGSGLKNSVIVALMAMPQQMVAIPIFQILVNLKLIDSYIGLILVHTAWGLPWIILFLRNFFLTLPTEVEEAARVDGASDFTIFRKIVLPMTLPAILSVVSSMSHGI